MQTKQLKGGNPVNGASRCAKQWKVCMSIISLVLVVFISMSFSLAQVKSFVRKVGINCVWIIAQ